MPERLGLEDIEDCTITTNKKGAIILLRGKKNYGMITIEGSRMQISYLTDEQYKKVLTNIKPNVSGRRNLKPQIY